MKLWLRCRWKREKKKPCFADLERQRINCVWLFGARRSGRARLRSMIFHNRVDLVWFGDEKDRVRNTNQKSLMTTMDRRRLN